MTKALLTTALLLSALPALAQTKPLTPPDVLGAAKTIQFAATDIVNDKVSVITMVTLVQPNKAYIQRVDRQAHPYNLSLISDGTTEILTNGSKYTKVDPPAHLADITGDPFPIDLFMNPASFSKYHHDPADPPGLYRRTNPYHAGVGLSQRSVLIVDPATGLPSSIQTFVKLNSAASEYPTSRTVFSGWKLNAPIANSKFAYTPPAGAELITVPKLLANGTVAPDFTVQDKDGKAVKLSDYKGKTVVLDFWATWCGPCQSSMPHTTEMAKKYADKNVVVLAVNVWDTPAAFQAWLPMHPEYVPLHFVIDPNPDKSKSVASAFYSVSGIPTQYVIGPNGKIEKSIVGYDPKDTQLEDALKTAAVGTGN